MIQLIVHGFTYDPPAIPLQLVNRTTTDFIINHDDNKARVINVNY